MNLSDEFDTSKTFFGRIIRTQRPLTHKNAIAQINTNLNLLHKKIRQENNNENDLGISAAAARIVTSDEAEFLQLKTDVSNMTQMRHKKDIANNSDFLFVDKTGYIEHKSPITYINEGVKKLSFGAKTLGQIGNFLSRRKTQKLIHTAKKKDTNSRRKSKQGKKSVTTKKSIVDNDSLYW